MNLIQALCERAGGYRGTGTLAGGRELTGGLIVTPVADGLAVALELELRDADGGLVEAEHAVVAGTPDGTLALYPVSTSVGFVLVHALRREADGVYVFACGDVDDRSAFRQEVTLELHDDGHIGWRVAWAQPGEDVAARRRLRLAPAD